MTLRSTGYKKSRVVWGHKLAHTHKSSRIRYGLGGFNNMHHVYTRESEIYTTSPVPVYGALSPEL
jgi:hypothetical protein